MPNAANSIWTDERVVELCKLWADGYSCSQIARAMGDGVTRNSVIGKVHRLDLPSRAQSIFNINGATRFVDPTPLGTSRKPPARPQRPASRPRLVKEDKPEIPKKPTRGIIQVFSVITGNPVVVPGMINRPRQPEMSKAQLRNMLSQAVQNTAALS